MSAKPDGYNTAPDPWGSNWRECVHEWQPVTLALNVQMLDEQGRYVLGPIPKPDGARVYLVCLLCASHTYMETAFRYRLHGVDDLDEQGNWPEREDL